MEQVVLGEALPERTLVGTQEPTGHDTCAEGRHCIALGCLPRLWIHRPRLVLLPYWGLSYWIWQQGRQKARIPGSCPSP